jgi:hypothetical protein
MNGESRARDTLSCSVCSNQTEERCSYCLLPLRPEHGQHIQPWFSRQQVLVCTLCQATLEAIAQEEESLCCAAHAQHQRAGAHVL